MKSQAGESAVETRSLEMADEGPICPADLKPCPQDECERGDYCWALDGGSRPDPEPPAAQGEGER